MVHSQSKTIYYSPRVHFHHLLGASHLLCDIHFQTMPHKLCHPLLPSTFSQARSAILITQQFHSHLRHHAVIVKECNLPLNHLFSLLVPFGVCVRVISRCCLLPGSPRRRRTPSCVGYRMSFHTWTHWGHRRTAHTPTRPSCHHIRPRRCTQSCVKCNARWHRWTHLEHRWCCLEATKICLTMCLKATVLEYKLLETEKSKQSTQSCHDRCRVFWAHSHFFTSS